MDAPPVLNAKQAIAKHVNLKIALQFAITMQEQLTPEQTTTIYHPHLCSIGSWLGSPATARMRQHPAYTDLANFHLRFHDEMITIAKLIAAKRFYDASSAMTVNSAFIRASLALARSITAFDQVSKIALPG